VQKDTEKRVDEQDASGAPEPDKLTVAQQAAGAEAEAATDAAAEDEQAASDEAAGGTEAAEVEADAGSPDGEAAEAAVEADGAEEAEEAVVTERADEPAAEAAAPDSAATADPEVEPEAADGGDVVADLDAARAEAESYLDDLRRLQAEFDNYRKRMMREQTARVASASQALVARLLPVLDNFELAVSAAEQSRDFDRMLKGVEMVFGELREVLQSEGLVRIEAEGKPFDPERHEAVVAVEQEGAEPGTVVDVVRAGYELRGRVLRPAMVKVAK
jgi:molecular chaperone GrpE